MNSEITQSINDSIQEALSIEKHKFVFLGNANTGKTSIISRFMYDSYDPNYQSTIGIDFVSKTCHFGERSMRLQLWDTAGQERFRSLIPSYVRDSTVAVLVYDITNEKSFTDITKWYTDAKEQKEDIITILVGNKTDLEDERVITKEEGIQKANDMNSLYIETSAKNGENVDSIFRKVISKIPQDKKEDIQESTKYIRITTEDMKAGSKDLNCQCFHVCFKKQFKFKPY